MARDWVASPARAEQTLKTAKKRHIISWPTSDLHQILVGVVSNIFRHVLNRMGLRKVVSVPTGLLVLRERQDSGGNA